MTIKRGEEWGSPVIVPRNIVIVNNDRHLAQMSSSEFCMLGSGDIWNALGQPALKGPGQDGRLVTIDAIKVEVMTGATTSSFLAASSIEVGEWVTIQRPLSRRRYVACTNGGAIGYRQLAPRAHPNDGFIDVFQVDQMMSFKQRILSSRKSRLGTHLPHPHISVTRQQHLTLHKSHPHECLFVDGIHVPSWQSVEISVMPDFWKVIL